MPSKKAMPSDPPSVGGKAASAALTPEKRRERASAGGRAVSAMLTPEERRERARRAVAVANSPAGRARSIVRAWPTLSRAERAEVREILRQGGVIPPAR